MHREKTRDLQRYVQTCCQRQSQAKTASLLGSALFTAHHLQDVAPICAREVIPMVTTAYLRIRREFTFLCGNIVKAGTKEE